MASAAVIMTVLKVVGTVASVVSMAKGIKDGNMMQAVLGGFGAFMGASSLASGAAASGASNSAGAVASEAASGGSIMGDTSTAAMFGPAGPGGASAATANLMEGAGSQGLLQMGGATNNILGSGLATGNNAISGSFVDEVVGQNGATERILGNAANEPGFFDQAKSLMKDNPELMKIGGGLLQGYSQGGMLEDQRDYLKRQEDAKRGRTGQTFVPSVNPFAAR